MYDSSKNTKSIIIDLLTEYGQANKTGPDTITQDKNFHAMAEAKYLLAYTELLKHKIIDIDKFKLIVDDSVQLLRKASILYKGYTLWGLGFSWLDRPADEPYLITSSICTLALLQASMFYQSPCLLSLLNDSILGLCYWINNMTINTTMGKFPLYSPNVKTAIYNPAAHCASVLYKVKKNNLLDKTTTQVIDDRLNKIYSITHSAFIQGIGWKYSEKRPIADLVHINYILSLYIEKLPLAEVEEIFVSLSGQYFNNGDLYERTRIIGDVLKYKLGSGSFADCIVRQSGNTWFSIDNQKSRLFGIGEFLVNASFFAKKGMHKLYWRNMIHSILNNLSQNESIKAEKYFFRNTMHLVHGLSCCLPFDDYNDK